MKAADAEAGAEVEVIKLKKPEQRARWYGVKKRESRRRLQARRKTCIYPPTPPDRRRLCVKAAEANGAHR
jgi:hypothetical protein